MGLAADRAKAHGAGRKTLNNFSGRFDIINRQGLVGELELHQTANGQKTLVLLVDAGGKGGIFVRQIAAHRMLQLGNRVWVPGMFLAADTEGIGPADIQRITIDRRIGIGVAVTAHGLFGDF